MLTRSSRPLLATCYLRLANYNVPVLLLGLRLISLIFSGMIILYHTSSVYVNHSEAEEKVSAKARRSAALVNG